MNTIALPARHPVQTAGVDHGLSPEAGRIRDTFIDIERESESRTVTSRKKDVLLRLAHAFASAMVPDWDGEGAMPVEASTYRYASQLVELLPADLPVPEIYPERDGDLAFEWDLERRRILSISVGRDGTLNYAGLFGGSKLHGLDFLADRIPPAIWIALAKLAAGDR